MFIIAKDYIFKRYRGLISGICRMHLICCILFFLFSDIVCCFLDTLSFSDRSVCFIHFQIEKLIDSVNTSHRRLDRLDLHTKAFHRCKDLGNIIDHGYRGSGRHTEEYQYLLIAGCG